MLCGDVHQFAAGLVKPLVDDCVCTFTEEGELSLWAPHCINEYTHEHTDENKRVDLPYRKKRQYKEGKICYDTTVHLVCFQCVIYCTYDGHPFADVVEIQDGQEFIASLLSHFYDGHTVWCT